MKLYYYRGEKPNFGDDLNAWMWPRLMPDAWNDDESIIFLGIGSIIYDFFPKDAKKIVFGAGYGGYTPLPVIDANWKFHFVRGNLTARSLNLNPVLAVGDAAILVRSCIKQRPDKQHKVSFMPHWESTMDGAWEAACKLASINYIDPTGTVDHVLDQILSSELVITEAMHGAIVADALRVPWIAVTPIQQRHQMKWLDWASALDLTLRPHPLGASSLLEAALQQAGGNVRLAGRIRRRGRFLRGILPGMFVERAAEQLRSISLKAPSLSRSTMMAIAHERMLEKLDALSSDLGR